MITSDATVDINRSPQRTTCTDPATLNRVAATLQTAHHFAQGARQVEPNRCRANVINSVSRPGAPRLLWRRHTAQRVSSRPLCRTQSISPNGLFTGPSRCENRAPRLKQDAKLSLARAPWVSWSSFSVVFPNLFCSKQLQICCELSCSAWIQCC